MSDSTTMPAPPLNPMVMLRELYTTCSTTVEASLTAEYEPLLGESYTFLVDLEKWTKALGSQPEVVLFETSTQEFLIALLNACQGQYRNAFKGLRLVLELCLEGVNLSVNLIHLNEWLNGDADTIWASLMDADAGPLSKRFSKAFFPELSEHMANFRQIAKALYRELSECIHGNIAKHIPLPQSLTFDKEAFLLWHEKARLVRLVVIFSLAMRYLPTMAVESRTGIEGGLLDQLGHIEALRVMFGGPQTG